jgi:hypothetical protein
VTANVLDNCFRRSLGWNDHNSLVEQGVKQRVDPARVIEQKEVQRSKRGPWRRKLCDEILEVVEDSLGSSRRSGREKDDARMLALSYLANEFVRLGCIAGKAPFALVASNYILREAGLEEILVISFGPVSERHKDGAHVEQSKRERNAVRVEVSNDSDNVARADSFESRIVALCGFFYLRKAERFARTDKKRAVPIALAPGEIIEEAG